MNTAYKRKTGKDGKAKVREPVQRRSIKAKQAIIASALPVFSRKGYHGCSIKDLTDAAGVSVGTFYAYFPDKRSLFRAAMQEYWKQFNGKIYESLDAIDFTKPDRRKTMREFVETIIDAHNVWMAFHDELAIMTLSDPEFREDSRCKAKESRKLIRDKLEIWRDKIEATDLDATAALLYDLVHAAVDTIVFKKTSIGRERMITGLTEMMGRACFGKLDLDCG